jgi:hypothetical protein
MVQINVCNLSEFHENRYRSVNRFLIVPKIASHWLTSGLTDFPSRFFSPEKTNRGRFCEPQQR